MQEKCPFYHIPGKGIPRALATLLAQKLSHLQHFWHKCFLICNTSGTSALSFATFLSLMQHPLRSWCPCNIPATLPLHHLHRSCCHLQHLCSVVAPATSLLRLVPLQHLCSVGFPAAPLLQLVPLQHLCLSWCLCNTWLSQIMSFFTPLFVNLCTKKPPPRWSEKAPLKNQWARSR